MWAKCGHGSLDEISPRRSSVACMVRHMRLLVPAVCLLISSVVVACGSDSATAPETVTVSASPTAEAAVTWKYLQSGYGDFLAQSCSGPELGDADYGICIIKQMDGIEPFAIDAEQLPVSPARAELLSSVNTFTESYENYIGKGCKSGDFDCLGHYAGMAQGFAELGRIVNREAAN